MAEKATRQHTKEYNRNLVLRTIFELESISRAGIARITSLTPTTVSDIVAELVKEGLISEIGVGPSIGGKNPILLSMVEDSRYLIGLDLANNQFRGAVVNLRGEIRDLVTIPVMDRDGAEALSLVFEILDKLIKSAHKPIIGIGVGTPGIVNTGEGVVINAVNLNWKNLPLTKLLQERYHLPVKILNDCQAAAIGEKTYSKNQQRVKNLILINIRHGIGAGIVINDELFQGDGGSAGEIGHVVVVNEGGEMCRCGNRGCLETVASVKALIRQVRALPDQYPGYRLSQPSEDVSLESIIKAFNDGDRYVSKLVLDTAYYIGNEIAALVGTLNIQKIILAGDMTRFGDVWLQKVMETMKERSLEAPLVNTDIEVGQLGEDSIILGASAVLANDYSLLFNR